MGARVSSAISSEDGKNPAEAGSRLMDGASEGGAVGEDTLLDAVHG